MAIVVLSMVAFLINMQLKARNAIVAQGFVSEGEYFVKQMGAHQIKIELATTHKQASWIHHRNMDYAHSGNFFYVNIVTTSHVADLPTLFCSQLEYESNQKLGRWYPTPAVILANDYPAGKCFPPAVIQRILALPKKKFKMDSYLEMKLYMPKKVAKNTYYKQVRFLSTDAAELPKELELFLRYYEIQLGL